MVDLLVAVRVLPLQFASLLLVTLPLTMPRLLALQLAKAALAAEGSEAYSALAILVAGSMILLMLCSMYLQGCFDH